VGGGLLSPLLVRWWGGFRGAWFWTGFADVLAQLGFLVLPAGGILWAAMAGAATAVALTLGMAAPAVFSTTERTGRVSGILLAWGYGIGALGPLGVGLLRQVSGSFLPGFWLLAALGSLWTVSALFMPKTTATGTSMALRDTP
jgi:CP family cyanate transporter-like MFS transporter